MRYKIFLPSMVVIMLGTLLVACNPQRKILGNYEYKTECMGVELDGSQTVKAWGNGRNRWDAMDQARKNAIRDVIFKGILEGKNGCEQKPIIFEVNAEEKYKDYFNVFFKDDGEYAKYISSDEERLGQRIKRDRKKARESVTHGFIVRVKRNELIQKLKTDGIIK